MKSFDVPIIYRSPLISAIKKKRKEQDKMKKDFTDKKLEIKVLEETDPKDMYLLDLSELKKKFK